MKPPSRSVRSLTSAEVAIALGVSKTTLLNWLRAGKVPEPARDPNNNYRIWTPEELAMVHARLYNVGGGNRLRKDSK